MSRGAGPRAAGATGELTPATDGWRYQFKCVLAEVAS